MREQRRSAESYEVRAADWQREGAALRAVRREVFILEQNVPEEEEWDGLDPECLHVIALTANREPVGTGRLTPTGKLGRIAVCRDHRRRGVGGQIVGQLMHLARQKGVRRVYLHAQTHAVRFYERHGFGTYGPQFLEAGIPHLAMQRTLTS